MPQALCRPRSAKHISASESCFSSNLFHLRLIRPHFPLFSHTPVLTVNPRYDVGCERAMSLWALQMIFWGKFKEKFPRTRTDTSALKIYLLKGISYKQLHPFDQQPTHEKSWVCLFVFWSDDTLYELYVSINYLMFGFDSSSQKCFQEHKMSWLC